MGSIGSAIGRIHERLYNFLCGAHPKRYPWHAQWLSVRDLYRELRAVLATLDGSVLDIGCGNKPYGPWLLRANRHVGMDVKPGPHVDHVVPDGADWPFADASFQAVIGTQVLQHMANLPRLVEQIDRVLAPNGTVVLTFPFCYNDMTVTFDKVHVRDYWRLTVHGARQLFPAGYEIVTAKPLGGVGSALGVMWINWLTVMMTRNNAIEMLYFLLLPLWIPFCAVTNLIGRLLDTVDRSGIIYHDVILVLRKKAA